MGEGPKGRPGLGPGICCVVSEKGAIGDDGHRNLYTERTSVLAETIPMAIAQGPCCAADLLPLTEDGEKGSAAWQRCGSADGQDDSTAAGQGNMPSGPTIIDHRASKGEAGRDY